MDAIALLKRDHAAVERLFVRFEHARRPAERKRIAGQLVRELSVHAAIEEQLVYPRLRALARDGQDERVLFALEEHHATKLTLAEIDALGAADERLPAKVHVLAENVRAHVREEERDLLPALKRATSAVELRDLGATLAKAKALAPTRPHPSAPDQPPGSLPATAAASAYDRSKDAVGRAVQAARDLVGEALRRGERAAERARRQVEGAARDARHVARSARATARRTANDAARVARESAQAGARG